MWVRKGRLTKKGSRCRERRARRRPGKAEEKLESDPWPCPRRGDECLRRLTIPLKAGPREARLTLPSVRSADGAPRRRIEPFDLVRPVLYGAFRRTQ